MGQHFLLSAGTLLFHEVIFIMWLFSLLSWSWSRVEFMKRIIRESRLWNAGPATGGTYASSAVSTAGAPGSCFLSVKIQIVKEQDTGTVRVTPLVQASSYRGNEGVFCVLFFFFVGHSWGGGGHMKQLSQDLGLGHQPHSMNNLSEGRLNFPQLWETAQGKN